MGERSGGENTRAWPSSSENRGSIISFSSGVWDHISGVMADVCDLEQRVQKAKENVEEIQSIVQSWESPIFERRDSRKESVLSLEECQERLDQRYSLVRESGHRIHSLLKVRGHLQDWVAPQRLRCSLQH